MSEKKPKISFFVRNEDERSRAKAKAAMMRSDLQKILYPMFAAWLNEGAPKRPISKTNTDIHDNDPLLTAISNLRGNQRAMVAIQALVEALTGRDLNDETENLDRAAAAARSLDATVEKARTAVRKTTTRKGAWRSPRTRRSRQQQRL